METKTKRIIQFNDFIGGSLQGEIVASYDSLVKAFGPPNSQGDGYKISTEWCLMDTKANLKFSLYDYKETNLYSGGMQSVKKFRARKTYSWHIGYCDRRDIFNIEVREAIQEQIKNSIWWVNNHL